jgi:hypothetical protein
MCAGPSASAMPAVTAASAQATVSGAVLGTVLSKAVLISLGIVLAMAGTGIVLTVTGPASILSVWKKPAILPWPGTGQPRFDTTMEFMGMQAGYVFLRDVDIVASHNPDQDDWRCFVHWPREQDVQLIAAVKDKPSNATLVLEQDHWIEYRIPAPLRDRPGPEIGLYVFNGGTLPSVTLTDGDQQLQQISVTHYRASHAPGYMILGFDLSAMAIDFKVRRIRFVGHDREGRFGGCGVTNIAVSLATRN